MHCASHISDAPAISDVKEDRLWAPFQLCCRLVLMFAPCADSFAVNSILTMLQLYIVISDSFAVNSVLLRMYF